MLINQFTLPFLLLLIMLPFNLMSFGFGLASFMKKSSETVEQPLNASKEELFQSLVDELVKMVWDEQKCTDKFAQSGRNPFYFKSKQKLALQLKWVENANCIKYEESKTLVDLFERITPKGKGERFRQNNWNKFFEFLYKEFPCPANYCELEQQKALENAKEIREQALATIVDELTLRGEKCLGIEIVKIETPNLIHLEVENLKKLKCGINLQLKWLKINADLFNKLPLGEGEQANLIPIDNQSDLLEKVAKWIGANKMFTRVVKIVVQKIFSKGNILMEEKSSFFLRKMDDKNEQKYGDGYNFNLDAFTGSSHFYEVMKKLKEHEKRMMNHDAKTWFKNRANKCWHKNAAGIVMQEFTCAPIEAGDQEMVEELEREMFKKEYEQYYKRMVEQLAMAYLLSETTGEAAEEGEGLGEACAGMKPFHFGPPLQGHYGQQRRRTYLRMGILLNWRGRPFSYRDQTQLNKLTAIADDMAKMKQFEGAIYSKRWESLSPFLLKVHAYFDPTNGTNGPELVGRETIDQIQANCHQCWTALLSETVNAFLGIQQCLDAANTGLASNKPLKFDENTKLASTSMEMLMKQNPDCLSGMQEWLYEMAQFDDFAGIFPEIKTTAFANGKRLSDTKDLETWTQFMCEIDKYLNPARKEFQLGREQSEIAAKHFYETDMDRAYKILGLRNGCTFEEFKKAYKQGALRLHPDKTSDEKDWQDFKTIKDAYDKLKNENALSVQSPKEKFRRGK